MCTAAMGPGRGMSARSSQCTLSVVAGYEWDAFGLPDLRSDWYVHRLKIEHRQIDHVPGRPGAGTGGRAGQGASLI
jgi:hypothetical protein